MAQLGVTRAGAPAAAPAAYNFAPQTVAGYQVMPPQSAAPALGGGLITEPLTAAAPAPPAPFGGGGGFPNLGALNGPPKRQTDGMPTPDSIKNQKLAFAKALEQQLEQGQQTIRERTRQAMQILQNAAEEKKLQFAMQTEEELMHQEFQLDEQCHKQIMQLQEAAFKQKAQLEHQASALIMEYKQKHMQEAMQEKLYESKMKQHQQREMMQQRIRDMAMQRAGPQGAPDIVGH
eukprot:gb/GFBE01053247.1/.p1 GENE.gb/GFBE01053247.1/~~gb/GFBE01053247.1/.p1  ORF type:complete len:233 (+),score=80.97 gb/GFBE01053247.1/:1-699(+)